MHLRAISSAIAVIVAVLGAAACSRPDVTVYCALDQVHSEPLLRQFERETGLTVGMQFDVEAVKTIGLTNKIVAEKDNPKCDVFWNNELVHTLRLKKMGLLEKYESPSAADIPDRFKDPEGYWVGFGARARVFILNTETASAIESDEAKWPDRTEDLLNPVWKGQIGMARPDAGTTLTHMAVLWTIKGADWVKGFWTKFRDNDGRQATGNAHLMKEVRDGRFTFGYTDTDDYRVAEIEGYPVRQIFPDQESGGEIHGCLVIPNSVALMKNGPHPAAAKKLIDFIFSKKVEEQLAHGPSAQMPVRKSVPRPDHVMSADDLVTLDVDWLKVADAVEPFSRWFKEFAAE